MLSLTSNRLLCVYDRWVFVGFIVLAWMHLATAQGTSSTVPTVVHGSTVASIPSASPNCTNVRPLLESRGIIATEIPVTPINGKFFFLKIRRSKCKLFMELCRGLLIKIECDFLFSYEVRKFIFMNECWIV